ncbi:MAG: NAD-dependent epimerase/dehydratase family protein [Armatimonadetes bacterium]|nr:NAD-dependent epimerase/dehydratase family protein [Armatimonadota bacterium]
MEVLVTGANGLLGRHLVAALRSRGDKVRALVLPAEDAAWLEQRRVTIHRGDVRAPETLVEPVRGADIVFHLAGMMGVWCPISHYHAVNVTGTENVCRAALAAKVNRLVHVSSWTVYGMTKGFPLREEHPLAPFPEPYALTKTRGEQAVWRFIKEERLPAAIIRPDTFFGPGDRVHFGRMADRVAAGKGIIVGSGRNVLPFVYVTDVAQGLLLAAERDRAVGQAYNIASDHPLTQGEIWEAIAEDVGARAPSIHVPYHALYAAAVVIERAADLVRARRQPIITRLGARLFGTDNRHAIDKACRELGYAPRVPVREGLRLAAEWHNRQRARPTDGGQTPLREAA